MHLCTALTELQLLRDLYFGVSSFEFYLINLLLLYGILAIIVGLFLMHYFFYHDTFTQMADWRRTNSATALFIRTQNFIKQQMTMAGVRVWTKARHI